MDHSIPVDISYSFPEITLKNSSLLNLPQTHKLLTKSDRLKYTPNRNNLVPFCRIEREGSYCRISGRSRSRLSLREKVGSESTENKRNSFSGLYLNVDNLKTLGSSLCLISLALHASQNLNPFRHYYYSIILKPNYNSRFF